MAMTRMFLRWTGGSGGDVILKHIKQQNPQLYINCDFGDLTAQGRVSNNSVQHGVYPVIESLNKYAKVSSINVQDLVTDITQLNRDHSHYICKLHMFDHSLDQLSQLATVETIGFSTLFLPFVVQACFCKTLADPTSWLSDWLTETNELTAVTDYISKKVNTDLKKHHTIWLMTQDAVNIHRTHDLDSATLKTDHWFDSREHIENFFNQQGYQLKLASVFDQWIDINKQYLPSDTYIKCVQSQTYDYEHSDLNIFEKYSLYALTHSKFKLLN